MNLKTLLISENKSDWETFRKMLNASYTEIQLVCALNVEEAMTAAASDGPFGFFILDCNMREADPNALGQNLIEFTGNRPIIFFGHETVINDRITQDFFQSNEFNEKIYKPFERDDFLEDFRSKIDKALLWAKEEEFEQSIEEVDPNEYIPMKIKAFFLYNTFPYDIFLAITQSTYIKIISANKPYAHSTLSNYAKKNVKFLFIKKDEQLKYLENETTKCLKALRSIDVNNKDLYLLQLRSITILHQYILALGVSPSVLILANAITDSTIQLSKNKSSLGQIFSEYPYFYEGTASKSLLTSYIAEAVAKKLGWDSETTKKKLSICSLLQDITLPEESMSKINSSKSSMLKPYNDETIKKFLSHSVTAAEYAKQFTSYSDIDYIIESHHELPNRKGFPNRPPSSKLTKVCAVFNSSQFIASELDGEMITNITLSKVVKTMAKDYNVGVFKEIQNIIKTVLKIKSS